MKKNIFTKSAEEISKETGFCFDKDSPRTQVIEGVKYRLVNSILFSDRETKGELSLYAKIKL